MKTHRKDKNLHQCYDQRTHCLWVLLFFCFGIQSNYAQDPNIPKVHSHNDYNQEIPFWNAYIAGASSIESDIFLQDSTLYVTHHKSEIIPDRTLNALYLDPIATIIKLGFKFRPITLLIDIKSEPYATLKALETLLNEYPNIISHPGITFIISGSRPRPCDYRNHPSYMLFDHQSKGPFPDCLESEKIGMISFNFRSFSRWDGMDTLSRQDKDTIKRQVELAHHLGKPIRFWATPDTEKAWKVLASLGIDFINTDLPMQCVQFYNNRH